MLIVFTGLHAAGKSYFTEKLSEKYSIRVYNKKKILKEIFLNEEEINDSHYREWFKEEFYKNPVKIISRIINRISLEENAILDSVHSYTEWKIINKIVPDSILVSVFTPKDIRYIRQDEGDEDANIKRIKYWHSDYEGEKGCLLSEVSWAFNGAASLDANLLEFEELLTYIENNKKNNIDRKLSLYLKKDNSKGSDINE